MRFIISRSTIGAAGLSAAVGGYGTTTETAAVNGKISG